MQSLMGYAKFDLISVHSIEVKGVDFSPWSDVLEFIKHHNASGLCYSTELIQQTINEFVNLTKWFISILFICNIFSRTLQEVSTIKCRRLLSFSFCEN